MAYFSLQSVQMEDVLPFQVQDLPFVFLECRDTAMGPFLEPV